MKKANLKVIFFNISILASVAVALTSGFRVG